MLVLRLWMSDLMFSRWFDQNTFKSWKRVVEMILFRRVVQNFSHYPWTFSFCWVIKTRLWWSLYNLSCVRRSLGVKESIWGSSGWKARERSLSHLSLFPGNTKLNCVGERAWWRGALGCPWDQLEDESAETWRRFSSMCWTRSKPLEYVLAIVTRGLLRSLSLLGANLSYRLYRHFVWAMLHVTWSPQLLHASTRSVLSQNSKHALWQSTGDWC